MDTIYQQSKDELTQVYDKTLKNLVPPIITTGTAMDYQPDMSRLTSSTSLSGKETDMKLEPSLTESTLTNISANLTRQTVDIPITDKEFSKLTIGNIYDNTIKTAVSIVNDFSELISEKEVLSNTEFRRKLLGMFLMKDRRMYVGIMLVIISFILYFIDTST